MDEQQLRQLKPELDCFLDRYAPLFGKDENQAHARRFVQGLLHKGERRNTENSAEALQGGPVRSLQAFITTGGWRDTALLTELRRQVLEGLADEDAVWNSDEAGFPKKGAKSVGVKRQYSGTLGRTDNCQIGVLANYCSCRGHTFMDRRLFLPEEWANDPERRKEAGVPDDVIFRTKPALALEMVAQAVAEGIVFRWVGGDSVYGDNPTFVRGVRSLGKWYVLDIACDIQVWTAPPQVIAAEDRPQVAHIRDTRWTIEEDIASAKGECGLAEYETRGWVGWHHHTALSMLALLFLVLQKQRLGEKEAQMTVPEVRALLHHLLDVRVWDDAEILKWSNWRRERNRRAAASHRKRRLAEQRPPPSKRPSRNYSFPGVPSMVSS